MIAEALRRAEQMHKQVLEQTYNGKCTVMERQPYKDTITKITDPKREITVLTDQPCKLAYAASPAASGSPAASAPQSIKLFLTPEIVVKPGSKIIVTQDGRTAEYGHSGLPVVYASHQEIELELWKGWT